MEEYFNPMQHLEMDINNITFVYVIRAHAYAGLVCEGDGAGRVQTQHLCCAKWEIERHRGDL